MSKDFYFDKFSQFLSTNTFNPLIDVFIQNQNAKTKSSEAQSMLEKNPRFLCSGTNIQLSISFELTKYIPKMCRVQFLAIIRDHRFETTFDSIHYPQTFRMEAIQKQLKQSKMSKVSHYAYYLSYFINLQRANKQYACYICIRCLCL